MKHLLISFILFTMLVSCTDLNDTLYDQIPSDLYPENAAQTALIPVATYAAMQPLLDNGGWWFCQEVTSDEMVAPTRATDWEDGGKWRVLHQHTWNNNTEAINNMWSTYYNGVFEANQAIENIGEPNITAKATLIAQLKVLRAFYYYLLIDNYGDVPFVTSFATAPKQPEKEDREIIFANIVNDIEQSIPDLRAVNIKTSVTKGMAFSLLAKLYINAEVYTGTAQWAKAEEACDSVIALGLYSLESDPLGPFVTQNQNSPENIFTIPYDEDNYQGFNLHMRTLHYNHNLTFDMPVGPWNGFAVMESHYNSYASNDLRKKGFLVGQQYTSSGVPIKDPGAADANLILDPYIPALFMTAANSLIEIRMSGARVAKFEIKKGAKANLSNDFPLFRYADILLMKAECMIRRGGNGDSYVNQIRTRAGVPTLSSVNLATLLEERGREMFWEGHRRQDQIRFGTFNNAWWEKPASTPDRNIFPIPQWAIDANPNLAK